LGAPTCEQPRAAAPATSAVVSCNEASPALREDSCFLKRFLKGYPTLVEWFPKCLGKKEEKKEEKKEDKKNDDAKKKEETCGTKTGTDSEDSTAKYRRALPAPFNSPPFPTAEYQGFPLIGVPPSDSVYPLMGAIYGGPCGDAIKQSRVKLYGWLNASGN